jgi:hypothetical protein
VALSPPGWQILRIRICVLAAFVSLRPGIFWNFEVCSRNLAEFFFINGLPHDFNIFL